MKKLFAITAIVALGIMASCGPTVAPAQQVPKPVEVTFASTPKNETGINVFVMTDINTGVQYFVLTKSGLYEHTIAVTPRLFAHGKPVFRGSE